MNQKAARIPGAREDATDRRRDMHPPVYALKQQLNPAQLDALNSLEQFGWYLKFIRHNPPQAPVAVLCDPDKHEYALLSEQGELIENPAFESFRE
ncbi:MAG: hypothetical protein M3374_06755 [Pseudomonadota bacterium]|nr:hypothetical protein [Pseudomonadota bacterium]